ncbi:MAG TPA: hypothetical protein VFI73_09615 [Candidatus Nitrosopolaris sp.]|nr:hypothetical protein [Candidatus Nitrosopolaris sp.]
MAIDSNDGHPARDQTVTDPKIQLLTNQIEKDYALRLKGKSELLAVTNPSIQKSEYTKVIAESDYYEDFEYRNWDYTLNHWIAYENKDRGTASNKQ